MATELRSRVVEAGIKDLLGALESGYITAVDLLTKYLLRISTYDCRDTALNSIPLLNINCFTEAEQSDDRRYAGRSCGPLEGIPFTVKDSYKVKEMTVASGSEAFKDLIANEDAFTVDVLRKAGAVLIGKTNMCPMAYGGMLRGVYGRAESPYNSRYLAAAFASGSSNGSGVSTAASFAAFGMGEETVSSGRSPASNNGIVAYTPSRGLISIRGNWPLYPTCDTVVPHTRSMDDLLNILDVLTKEDTNTAGDFWRNQPFVKIPKSWNDRPTSFSSLRDVNFLKGRRIAAPAMYLGGIESESNVHTSDAVSSLFFQAKSELEACGAIVEICPDYPAITVYEDPTLKGPGGTNDGTRLPRNWNTTERGTLIAHGWDDFLRMNDDPQIPTLAEADSAKMFPQLSADDPQVRFSEVANAVNWSKLASYVKDNTGCGEAGKRKIFDIPDLDEAAKALEQMRKSLFEDWMSRNDFDLVVFPAAGDVGFARADIDIELAEHTWKNGVKYSNGNRALRHLGIPSITVTMGMIPDKQMPMGLTFLGEAYNDVAILKAGYAYEQQRQRRVAPPLTPPLPSDGFGNDKVDVTSTRPKLEINCCSARWTSHHKICVSIEGNASFAQETAGDPLRPNLEIYIDAVQMSNTKVAVRGESSDKKYSRVFDFSGSWLVCPPQEQNERNRVVGKIARDSTMIIILARDGKRGRPSGCLRLIHMGDVTQ